MAILGKAKQIERRLRTSIERGRWEPGEAVPSERELSADLGVSRVAVRDAILALRNDGLLVRRQGSGTFVASSVGQRQVALLCTLNDLTSGNRFFARAMIEELKQRIDAHGYKGVLGVGQGKTGEDVVNSVSVLDPAQAKHMAGAISVNRVYPAVHERLAGLHVPSVTIDVAMPTSPHQVLLDYAAMLDLGARVLHEAGQDDFAIMAFEFSFTQRDAPDRVFEFMTQSCLSAVNHRPERIVLVPEERPELAHDAFIRWWQSVDRPRALFFADDVLCDVACRAITELGICVPNDLLFISESSTASRFHFARKVASLEFSIPRLADAAWDMLVGLIQGQPPDPPARYIGPVYRSGETL